MTLAFKYKNLDEKYKQKDICTYLVICGDEYSEYVFCDKKKLVECIFDGVYIDILQVYSVYLAEQVITNISEDISNEVAQHAFDRVSFDGENFVNDIREDVKSFINYHANYLWDDLSEDIKSEAFDDAMFGTYHEQVTDHYNSTR